MDTKIYITTLLCSKIIAAHFAILYNLIENSHLTCGAFRKLSTNTPIANHNESIPTGITPIANHNDRIPNGITPIANHIGSIPNGIAPIANHIGSIPNGITPIANHNDKIPNGII